MYEKSVKLQKAEELKKAAAKKAKDTGKYYWTQDNPFYNLKTSFDRDLGTITAHDEHGDSIIEENHYSRCHTRDLCQGIASRLRS